jgi:hypothetical protein
LESQYLNENRVGNLFLENNALGKASHIDCDDVIALYKERMEGCYNQFWPIEVSSNSNTIYVSADMQRLGQMKDGRNFYALVNQILI